MGEETIFAEALRLSTPEQRAAYLDQVCAGQPELRKSVESLLAAYDAEGKLLEEPPAELAATLQIAPVLERPGSVIGPYRLLELIGEGGMGVVYRAEQREPVRREVALKIIKPGMDTPEVIGRFEAERQALALMDHTNIAKVLDAGATETGRPYFVMELVRGVPITDFCDQHQLTLRERLDLFTTVCQAVQHAHQKGIIHRDIKPSNVLVSMHDVTPVVKIIDFGVAKAVNQRLTERTLFTKFSQMVGTPLYMSPEQAGMSDLDIDTRSDIYSLGVLLYELLTGTTPFDRHRLGEAAFDEIRRIIREEEPPKPSTRISTLGDASTSVGIHRKTDARKLSALVRGDLDWIVMKALEKDRTRRYETASEFASDICRYVQNEPIIARPPSVLYRFGKFARRNKAALSSVGLFALVLVSATVVTTCLAIWALKAENLAENRYQDAERARQGESEQRQLAEKRRLLVEQERDIALKAEARAQAIAERERQARQRIATLSEQDRRRLVQLNVAAGQRMLEAGDIGGSLPRFVEALRLDSKDEQRAKVHRVRIFRCLEQCPKPTHLWFHEDQVGHAEFSPDGERVVTGSRDAEARVWSLVPDPSLVAVMKHDGPLNHTSFSPDGRLIVTASDDATARVWNSSTGEPVTPPLRHNGPVLCARISPDARHVATASADMTARVWKIPSGEALTPPLRHNTAVNDIVFHPSGRRLFGASGPFVRAWDVTGAEEDVVPLANRHAGKINGIAIESQGRYLATAAVDHTAQVWDALSGEPLAPSLLHDGPVLAVTFSPDGTMVITASADGTARIWDVSSSTLLHKLPHADHVYDVACSQDGLHVVTACNDGTARLWETKTGDPIGAPLRHAARVNRARVSAGGRWLLTASDDHSARVWDLASTTPSGLPLGSTDSFAIVNTLFSSDGEKLLTVNGIAVAKIWDSRTGEPIVAPMRHHVAAPLLSHLETFPNARGLRVSRRAGRGGKFSPSGRRVLTWDWNGTGVLWDLSQQNEPLASVLRHSLDEPPYQICHADLSPDGQLVGMAVSSKKQPLSEVRVWSVTTGKTLSTIRQPQRIRRFAFTPDNSWLITLGTSGSNDEVRFWDVDSGKQVGPTLEHAFPVTDAQFSNGGELLLTICEVGGVARVWDLAAGTPVSPWLKHTGQLTSAAFSPDDRLVVTTGADRTARVWDIHTGEVVARESFGRSKILSRLSTVKWRRFPRDSHAVARTLTTTIAAL